MDQYQPFGRVRIDLKFSQAFQKIFRILGLPMEKRADDKLLFVRLVPAVLAKLLFTDQKAGDTLCQKGILIPWRVPVKLSDSATSMVVPVTAAFRPIS